MTICGFILFLSVGSSCVPASFRPLLLLGPFIFVQSKIWHPAAIFGVQSMFYTVRAGFRGRSVAHAFLAGRPACAATMLLIQGLRAFRFADEWSS